jgi:hypothetical protein
VLKTLSKELCLDEEEDDDDEEEESFQDNKKKGGKSSSSSSSSSLGGRGRSSSQSKGSKRSKSGTNKSSGGGTSRSGSKTSKRGGGRNSNDGADSSSRLPSSTSLVDDSAVVDNGQSWIQCDACSKWRRVPWYVDADMISEFLCTSSAMWGQNFSCSDPEEVKDIYIHSLIFFFFH